MNFRIFSISIAVLLSAAIFVNRSYALNVVYEPDTEDPTAEFPVIVVASSQATDIIKGVLEQLDVEAYIIEAEQNESFRDLEEFLSDLQADEMRIYLICEGDRNDCNSYAAVIKTSPTTVAEDLDCEKLLWLLEQAKEY